MNSTHYPKSITTLLLLTGLLVCTANGCRDPRDNRTPLTTRVTIELSAKEKRTAKFLNLRSFTPGQAGDNPKVAVGGRTHTVTLDPNVRELVFTVEYLKGNNADIYTTTLTIKYTCRAVLISPQCGCAYQYTIDSVDFEDDAQEVKILNPQLSSYNESPDVQIYL